MPCLGGLCPMPLRLGGSDSSSWTPEQHARACADVAAMTRSVPLAVVTFTTTGSNVIYAYNALYGSGLLVAPTLTYAGSVATLTWLPAYADSYEIYHPIHIRHAKATSHSATKRSATATIVAPNVVEVRNWNGAVLTSGRITLAVW